MRSHFRTVKILPVFSFRRLSFEHLAVCLLVLLPWITRAIKPLPSLAEGNHWHTCKPCSSLASPWLICTHVLWLSLIDSLSNQIAYRGLPHALVNMLVSPTKTNKKTTWDVLDWAPGSVHTNSVSQLFDFSSTCVMEGRLFGGTAICPVIFLSTTDYMPR